MSLSEIIPLVVVFAMYTSAVVGAVWLVVWGIGKLLKTMKTMRINKIVGCLKMTYKRFRLGGRFNAAKPLLYEVPTYLR